VFLTGTWSNSFNNSGNAYGVVTSGSSLAFYLVPSIATNCPFTATGTLSGTTIAGNYSALNCSVSDTGTFSVTQH
jgi:hypothetical protein